MGPLQLVNQVIQKWQLNKAVSNALGQNKERTSIFLAPGH